MPVSAYVQSISYFVLAALALFVSAGAVGIATYWVYLAIFATVFIVAFLRVDPDLARERLRPGGKRPPIALQLISVVLAAHWIVAGLDHGRFHWSDSVPPWLQWLSLIALAASYALCLWAMHVNRFFSSVIRIQKDRGQVVITTGPYAYIRHPGYLAGTLVMLASGLALDSWIATAFLAICALPFLFYRVIAEDRVLMTELSGYDAYAARVRWRLLPGLW